MTKTPHDHRPHGDGRLREGDEVAPSKDRIRALQSLLWNVNNVRVSDAQVGNVARSFQRELISILADLNKPTSAPETTQHPPGGAIREAQLYRALERLHYAVKNLAEAHAFDLTGPVKSDHESPLWLDLNDAQANAAQKIKHFAGPDVKAGSNRG